jgi:hypothetical protein
MHQTVCYDFTISMMRREMRNPKHASMGTLYWQLNDVWQVRGASLCGREQRLGSKRLAC